MKKILILAFLLLSLGTYAQREVPQSRMEQIYEEAKTPYKYGLLPSNRRMRRENWSVLISIWQKSCVSVLIRNVPLLKTRWMR